MKKEITDHSFPADLYVWICDWDNEGKPIFAADTELPKYEDDGELIGCYLLDTIGSLSVSLLVK